MSDEHARKVALAEARRHATAAARNLALLVCVGFLLLAFYGRPDLADDHPTAFLILVATALALAIALAVILFRAIRRDLRTWRR